MKKLILCFSAFLCVLAGHTQDYEFVKNAEIDSIIAEGKALYYLEMASWYGSDIFLERFPDKERGGYLSYTEGDESTFVYFTKGNKPRVTCTITFDHTFNTETAKVDGKERKFNKVEKELHAFRQKALAEVNTDTLFKIYNNTSLNLIPLIGEKVNKMYILTGPQEHGVMIFGNDYLLVYDKDHNLLSKKELHANIIVADFENEEGLKSYSGVHSHLPSTGDYITPTDICTLMLYEKFAEWESYIVMSEKYLSLWDCANDQLTVVTKESWDKVIEQKNQEKQD